ncbi:hypothetical protein [Aurantibacter sp.]|uniref:hypothetical protein n=1 Tax=Aurantibacter sp. TaxID=2807103 RepID=UPI0032646417
MKRISLKMTKQNRFRFFTYVMLIAFLSIISYSCSNDDNQLPIKEEETPNPITEISEEIKNLIYFKGKEKASTVLITIPGGPSTEFNTEITDLIPLVFNTTDILNVAVHQAQTLDSTIVKTNDITLNQAVSINNESLEILDQVVTYFKGQGRIVHILGFSFGAFVTQELIAKKGIASADKYLIMTGRLDINEDLWQASAAGIEGGFENGTTPVIAAEPDPDVKERNLLRISAGLGKNRYTQLLNTIEDLSYVTYIYGTTDEAVGSLTDEEVQFLESKNTNIIKGSGNHTTTLDNFIVQGLEDTFGLEPLQ